MSVNALTEQIGYSFIITKQGIHSFFGQPQASVKREIAALEEAGEAYVIGEYTQNGLTLDTNNLQQLVQEMCQYIDGNEHSPKEIVSLLNSMAILEKYLNVKFSVIDEDGNAIPRENGSPSTRAWQFIAGSLAGWAIGKFLYDPAWNAIVGGIDKIDQDIRDGKDVCDIASCDDKDSEAFGGDNNYHETWGDAESTGLGCPIILDLNGDGVHTTTIDGGVYFDHNNNALSELSAWVSKGDGILVWDRNNNGTIDNGGELFGNNTLLSNGSYAVNGFEALIDHDSNGDGIIDLNDAIFSSLRIWVDTNQDGISQSGELFTLSDLGIKSLNLSYQNGIYVDENGNEHRQTGNFTWADGSSGAMVDVWFQTDESKRVDDADVLISDEIKALPQIKGIGLVHDLQQAMALDESGQLQSLVNEFVTEGNYNNRLFLLDQIIFSWAEVDGYASDSRGSAIDGRILYALEKFLADDFLQQGTQSNPNATAAAKLDMLYNKLKTDIYISLMKQTHLKSYIDAVYDDYLNVLLGGSYADGAFYQKILSLNNTNSKEAENIFRDVCLSFKNNNDLILNIIPLFTDVFENAIAIDFDDFSYIIGGEGNNTLNGGVGDDFLVGREGNDIFNAGSGNDWLEGGAGNDTLNGGEGSDTYYFELGWGNDTINNYDAGTGKTDVILFGDGIKASDFTVSRHYVSWPAEDNLILTHKNGDTITIKNYFNEDGNSSWKLEEIRFADGTVLGLEDFKQMWLNGTDGNDYIKGFSGNDTMYGGLGNDQLFGESGDDILYGNEGNDILYGGTGNDNLYGGEGSDTYYFELGWGQDTITNYDASANKTDVILFGEGILASDITVTREYASWPARDDLVLTHKNGDKITVRYYFDSDGNSGYALDEIRFADGTMWNLDTIKQLAISGSEKNDVIYGYTADDVIHGYAGNDTIYGRDGNDTIYGGLGDDHLKGEAGDDILYGDEGKDLLYGGTGNDKLYGGAGDDTLMGEAGDDFLVGGAGNDSLNGGEGSDTYYFELGWGQDTITNYDASANKTDVILFGEGILASDITVTREYASWPARDDLVLTHKNGDKITVRYYFDSDGNSGYALDEICFADGTMWNLDTIKQLAISGSEKNDVMYGYTGDDVIHGYAGNDTIYGRDGNDTIYGGVGNDNLYGESGNDILYGNEGNDILYGGTGNDRLYGGDGDDRLFGDAGDDWLEGGAGNDTLNGGEGSDTYFFELGWGQDTISNYDVSANKTDKILFGEDISASDITVTREYASWPARDDLVLTHKNGDKITISFYFDNDGNSGYALDEIHFADGTVWSLDTFKVLLEDPKASIQFSEPSVMSYTAFSQIDALVSVMASFDPPVAAQTTMSAQQQNFSVPLLATSAV